MEMTCSSLHAYEAPFGGELAPCQRLKKSGRDQPSNIYGMALWIHHSIISDNAQ